MHYIGNLSGGPVLRARDETATARAPVPVRAAALHVERVSRSYGQGAGTVDAVRDVTLSVERGEFVALVGASGSGKSTLLHLMGGLDEPTSGTVTVDGASVRGRSDAEAAQMRRQRLGFVFQFFSLLPTMTAIENVAFPLLIDGRRDALGRAGELLESVGLGHRKTHKPSQLSGGEQQRVAIARALVVEPVVLLADEPTGSLDATSGQQILDLLRSTADAGQALVVATHDPAAASVADRIVTLRDGRLVA